MKPTLLMFEKFELITKFLSSLPTKKERPCLNLGDVVTHVAKKDFPRGFCVPHQRR